MQLVFSFHFYSHLLQEHQLYAYEERGFVPNVTFPCATIHDSVSGKIAVYYGCADSYVGLAFTTVDEIVDYIKTHSHVTESDTEIRRR